MADFPRREVLRDTFGDLAAHYHRVRPRYPETLFDDLVTLTGLAAPARLLEIGPGTGIATLELAARGFRVVGVELSTEMARTARHNLAAWDTVEIVTGPFEAFMADEPFHAALAFTAFHWIEPEARYARLARLLRSGGLLVVADSRLTAREDADSFFHEADADYVSVLGERASTPGAPALVSLRDEIEESGLFEHLATRNYLWHVTYAAPAYLELLGSFPWYATLEPADREELYARLQRRIEARGTITATFEAVLDVARLS